MTNTATEKEVSMDKRYRLRSTRTPVKVLEIVGALVTISHWDAGIYTCSIYGLGEFHKHVEEVPPYEDFTIDEPVMVASIGTSWYKRHFAGVASDGRAKVWDNGGTSFSSHPNGYSVWNYCRRPTKEELGDYKK